MNASVLLYGYCVTWIECDGVECREYFLQLEPAAAFANELRPRMRGTVRLWGVPSGRML